MSSKELFEAEKTLAMIEDAETFFPAIIRLLSARLADLEPSDMDDLFVGLKEDVIEHIERFRVARDKLFVATCIVCHEKDSVVLHKNHPAPVPICAGCRIDLRSSKPH